MRAAKILTLAFVLSVSSVAFADPTAADRESARAYMTEGRQKRDASDFKSALRAFQAADAIMHVPTTAFEIAKTESMMGLLVEARDESLRLARSQVTPGEPAPFAEARQAAQKLADDLESRIPSIRLIVKGNANVSVLIDDVALPSVAIGLGRKLNPGTHTIVAKSGANERRMRVQVLEREAKEVPIDFDAPEAVAVVGPTTTTKETTVATDSSTKTSSTPWLPIGIATLAVGVVGIGVGSVAGLISISDTNAIKGVCTGNVCPPSQTSALSDARTLAIVSDVGFIAGAVVAAIGITFIVVGAKNKSAASMTVGAAPGSFLIRGTF